MYFNYFLDNVFKNQYINMHYILHFNPTVKCFYNVE